MSVPAAQFRSCTSSACRDRNASAVRHALGASAKGEVTLAGDLVSTLTPYCQPTARLADYRCRQIRRNEGDWLAASD